MTTLLSLHFFLISCGQSQSSATQVCTATAGNRCSGDCIAVACLDTPSQGNDCTLNTSHGGLSLMKTEDLDAIEERCIETGGTWYRSAIDECGEMESLSGTAYEVEIGCIY